MRNAVLVLIAAAALACQRETPANSASEPSQTATASAGAPVEGEHDNTATMNPTVPTELDDPNARVGTAQPVQEVDLLEYRIDVPETLHAGKVIFNVENAGKENHAFEITGNGIESKTQLLSRGNSSRLEVELQPGTYTIYCPVDGHADKGMKKTIVVK